MSKSKLKNIQRTLIHLLGLVIDESEDTKSNETSLSDQTVVNGKDWKELKHMRKDENFQQSEFFVSSLMPSMTVIHLEINEQGRIRDIREAQ